MLEKLTLRNFQKHKDYQLEFDDKITTICGKTNQGKSSVIRAIWYLINNEFSGQTKSLIHHGKDDLSICLELDGKNKVVREQGKNGNIYKLNNKEYKAFGKGVPEEIIKLLNIGESNFSSQHSKIFWMMDSPGQVSRNLNSIVNLEVIDKTLFHIGKEVSKAKSTLQVNKNRLEEAKRKKNELVWVKDIDEDLKAIEELGATLARVSEKRSRIGSIVETGSNYLSLKGTLSRAVSEAGEGVLKIDGLKTRLGRIKNKKDKLCDSISKYTTIQKDGLRLNKELKEADKEFHNKLGDNCPLCGSENFSEKV